MPHARGLPRTGAPSIRELLARVRTLVRDAVANADVPFAVVVQDARVARSAAYNPVFQNMCVLQDAAFFRLPSLEGAAAEAMKVGGLTAMQYTSAWPAVLSSSVRQPDISWDSVAHARSAVTCSRSDARCLHSVWLARVAPRCAAQLDSTGAQVDLVLTLAESGDELTGTLEYCADLYTGDTVSRMADHFLVRPLEAAQCLSSHAAWPLQPLCLCSTRAVSQLPPNPPAGTAGVRNSDTKRAHRPPRLCVAYRGRHAVAQLQCCGASAFKAHACQPDHPRAPGALGCGKAWREGSHIQGASMPCMRF